MQPEPDISQFHTDPRWQAVERILAGDRFCRSPRLCDFLRFVRDETLLGRAEFLHEQLIGVKVFDRKVDYDSSSDNIVRSHASRLREKLEAYYLAEGKDEPWRVSLRRGSYIPQFELAAPPPLELAPKVASAVASFTSPSRWKLATICLALATLLLAALAVYQWQRVPRLAAPSQSTSPALRAFWQQVFPPSKRTLIVPADAILGTYKAFTDTKVGLDAYVSKNYLEPQPSGALSEITPQLLKSRYTSMADVELIAQLLRIPEAQINKPQVRFARDLQMADLKESNVIFSGAEPVNPWLAVFRDKRNFIITDDTPTRVINRAPLPGEPASYPFDPHDPQHIVYAIIATLPNLSGNGLVLIVEGTTIGGTEGAADFLTDPSQLEPVFAPAFQRYGRIPPFEMLLQTRDLSGSAPQTRLVAVRFHP
jgi:hypothetical protein